MVRRGRFERFLRPFDFSYVRVPGLAVVVAAGLGWRFGVLCFAVYSAGCIVGRENLIHRDILCAQRLGDDVMSLHSLVTLCPEGNRRLAMNYARVFCYEYRAMSWN